MAFHLEEPEPIEDLRPVFRVSRIAFFLLAFGIGLATLTPLCQALMYLARSQALWRALQSPKWNWGLIAPARVASFTGAVLLVNRWKDKSWVSRSLFLFLIQGYLGGMWFSDHMRPLGANRGQASEWTYVLSGMLVLISIHLMAWLAWDVCRKYQSTESEPLYHAAKRAASIGLGLWAYYLMRRIDWNQPWPPQLRFFDLSTLHVQIGALLARSVAGILTMILCGHACIVCSRELARVEKQVRDDDPFQSRANFF